MEREAEKTPGKKNSFRRHQRRWEILVIGPDGRTTPANYLKVLLPVLVGLFVTAIVVVVLTLWHAAEVAEEREALEGEVAQVREEARAHKEEVEVMTARLMRAGEKLAVREAGKKKSSEKKTVAAKTPPPKQAAEKAAVKTVPKQKETPPPKPKKEVVAPPKPKVGTDRFSATYDPAGKSLQLSFIIRNKGKTGKKVSGYAFIVLKPKNAKRTQWQIVPAVKTLDTGRPVRVEGGRFFEIARYRTLNFNRTQQTSPGQFANATVWVFDKDGNLLLEQDYPISTEVWTKALTG